MKNIKKILALALVASIGFSSTAYALTNVPWFYDTANQVQYTYPFPYANPNVGIGTTSPYAKLSVVGQIVASFIHATSTTATSTFDWGLKANALDVVSTTATSTFANGIQLSGGCFRGLDGNCIVDTNSGGTVTSIATNNGLTGGTITTTGTIGLDLSAVGNPFSLPLTLNGSNQLVATGTVSLSAPYLVATSTTATSSTQGIVLAKDGGSAGIGTTTPGNAAKLGVAGELFVGGTGTSTFAGGIEVPAGKQVCIGGSTTCLGGGGAVSPSQNIYLAGTTTIVTDFANVVLPAATTTSINAGETINITAQCNMYQVTGGGNLYLDIENPGGGTTTLSYTSVLTPSSTRIPFTLIGSYTATTSGKTLIALDSAMGNTLATLCRGYTITYIRGTNL